jgi:hypothetical protein
MDEGAAITDDFLASIFDHRGISRKKRLHVLNQSLDMLFERSSERIEPVHAADEVVEGFAGQYVFDAKRNHGHARADGSFDLLGNVG